MFKFYETCKSQLEEIFELIVDGEYKLQEISEQDSYMSVWLVNKNDNEDYKIFDMEHSSTVYE